MSARTSVRLRITSLVLLALLGTWIGHGVEYGLVAGWRGVALGLWGPLHSYMVPAALVLLVASFGLSLRVAALAGATQRRLEFLWRQLRRGVRHRVEAQPAATPWTDSHGVALALVIAVAQVALYLVQENLEAAVAGVPAPGLGALSGAHWSAAFVQLAIAAWLTLGWLLCSRFLRRTVSAVARIEALFRIIAGRRRTVAPDPTPLHQAALSQWLPTARAARAPPVTAAA